MTSNKSKLYPYAIGEVAEDSEEDSAEIEVFPTELYPTFSGDLTSKESKTRSGTNFFGQSKSISIETGATMTCHWIPLFNQFQITPPQVFKGQKVLLWKYDNIDLTFWTTLFTVVNVGDSGSPSHEVSFETNLKKREKYGIWLSDKESASNTHTPDDLNAGYYAIMDTINKLVRLHTSDNDGEATTYEISINTKDGELTIIDGAGNYIHLDTPNNHLTITTMDAVTVNTQNTVTVNTTDSIINTKTSTVNAENSVTVNTKDTTVNSTETATVITKVAKVEGSDSVDIKTSGICTIDSSTCKIN